MRQLRIAVLTLLPALLTPLTKTARAQATASATATQALGLSAFGGGTGTYTNVLGGRNLGITAGADLGFLTFHRYRPVLELRGVYPIHKGQIDAQKEVLGGLKVERRFGRIHPYVDFLVGRGQIDYQRGGLQVGFINFIKSTSLVYSPGVGLDFDVTPQWAIKADFQYQRWSVPFAIVDGSPAASRLAGAATTGTIHPKVMTLGAVYRFDFNHPFRRRRP